MMALQFIGPVLASILYVIVYQKAGFRGAILGVCAMPLVSIVLTMVFVRMLASGGMMGPMMLIPLVTIPLSLLPLIILAFAKWPPVGGVNQIGREL